MADQNLRIRIGAVDRTQRAFSTIRAGMSKIKSAVFSVQTAVVALAGTAGFGVLVKSTIETNREFQRLEASLKTFLGSSEKASVAFDVLQEFASKTPFALTEVVSGFNKLIAVGINPSIRTLTAFGNITSGVGKSLDQFVEAAADAAVGEFERLKEFGIKAKTQGDQIQFTFKGVTTTVKKSSEDITDFLVGLGETEFAGAIDEQSKTLNGAFSNLGDSFDIFKKAIGEAGFNEALIEVSKFFSQMAQNGNGLATSIGSMLASGVRLIPKIFINMGKAADFVSRNLDTIRRSLVVITAAVFAKAILGQAIAFIQFAGALLKAQKAMILYRAGFKLLTIGTAASLVIIGTMTNQLDRITNAIGRAAQEALSLADKAVPGLERSIMQLLPNLSSLEGELEANKNEAQLTSNSIAALDAKLAAVVPQMEKVETKTSSYSEELGKLKEAADKAQEGMGDVAVQGIRTLEDALTDVIMKTTSAKEAFKSMARSIIADIIKVQIQQSVTKPLSGIVSNIFSSFGQKAIGGPVQRGQPYLVGERGPEMFVPSRSGSIIPNSDMTGGGVVVNQSINISTGVSATVRSEIASLLPQIAEASKAAVLDARRRGGSFSAAFS